MRILGVSCYFHDAAAALLADGVLVAAAEEERFSRVKHDSGFPAQAIAFCLEQGGLSPGEVDYVVFYEKPLVKLRRILATSLATSPLSAEAFSRAMPLWTGERAQIRTSLARAAGVAPDRVLFVDHHVSHAASAFFCSPFERAALLTVDGVGEWTTTATGVASTGASGSRLELDQRISFPHSLGLLYSAFTAYLGFEVNEGEYKVMGMAPYGEPRYLDEVGRLLRVHDDGSFWLDMRYFTYHHSLRQSFNHRFEDLFGMPPRDPRAPFVTHATGYGADASHAELARNQRYADIAASIQRTTEEIVLGLAREAHRRSGSTDLCLAGGVALNGMANGRLLAETPFERVFIPPSPGDSGGALGAALYAHHVLLGGERGFTLEHAYWGKAYGDDDIRDALASRGFSWEELDEAELTARVTESIVAGEVVGWFRDRFEFGPRALGNRSILADPRRHEMKSVINEKIKFREPFRPFAPALLEQSAPDFVEGDLGGQYPPRFMLFVLPLRGDRADEIPAVSHFGTARVQTVRRDWNPAFYDLIESFGAATGVPVLINTSFNLRGEPIVATPADALSTFERSGLDALVLERYLVRKGEQARL